AIAALVFGRLFDRLGVSTLALVSVLTAFFPPLVFLGGFGPALLGMALWGLGMGAQESVMRAAVAGMAPAGRRGTAFGIFNSGFGVCWFLGSVLAGRLYDLSLPGLVGFSAILQLASVPLLLYLRREKY
ncbi:MAG: MFS transporter, partial [Syntrophomonadaceae bacterium]|nr:MFS transporter [Syntrophomonadaceae bacterium]